MKIEEKLKVEGIKKSFFEKNEKLKKLSKEKSNFGFDTYSWCEIFFSNLVIIPGISFFSIIFCMAFISTWFPEIMKNYGALIALMILGATAISIFSWNLYRRPKFLKIKENINEIYEEFSKIKKNDAIEILKSIMPQEMTTNQENQLNETVKTLNRENISPLFCNQLNDFLHSLEHEKINMEELKGLKDIKQKLGLKELPQEKIITKDNYKYLL